MPTATPFKWNRLVLAGLLTATLTTPFAARAEEPINTSPWNASIAGGMLDFEDDNLFDDAKLIAVRLGRDYDARWTFEGAFALAPELDENWRRSWQTGERVSRLEEAAGPGVHDSWTMRITADALYHLGNSARLDPFLALGAGSAWYGDGHDDDINPLIQGGVGCLYHLNENWALRADIRGSFLTDGTEEHGTYLIGLQWSPSSRTTLTPPPPVAAVPATTAPAAAAPVAVDTDHDGLTDAEEIGTTHTDPLRADTDWDALNDGDEVRKYTTDPLKRDSDQGGVYDGHEVIEDGTKPLERLDDLMVFELQFDYGPDDWKIKSEYFSEIGVIGKILKDDPTATARIEGHVDATAGNPDQLAEQRAQAVSDALVSDWGIAAERLTTKGYGASRPKGPSVPPAGNPQNARIEVYLPARTK